MTSPTFSYDGLVKPFNSTLRDMLRKSVRRIERTETSHYLASYLPIKSKSRSDGVFCF